MICPRCGQDAGDSKYCPHCGNAVEAPVVNTVAPTTVEENKPDMPMKWFKFLIYFSLWLSALSCLAFGLNMLTGSIYDMDADQIYYVFPGLQSVDKTFGLGSIILAGFAVYTRFRLAGFKKDGPKMLQLLYIANGLLGLVYTIAATTAVDGVVTIDFSSSIVGIIGAVIMVAANHVYFKKRAHLFTK